MPGCCEDTDEPGYLKPEEAKTIGSASRWVNVTRRRLDVPHSHEIKLENVLIAWIATGMDEGSLMSEFVALTFSKTRRRYTQQRIGEGAAGCSLGGGIGRRTPRMTACVTGRSTPFTFTAPTCRIGEVGQSAPP